MDWFFLIVFSAQFFQITLFWNKKTKKKWKNIHNDKKEKLYRTYKQKKKKSQNVPIDMADTYTNKLLYK